MYRHSQHRCLQINLWTLLNHNIPRLHSQPQHTFTGLAKIFDYYLLAFEALLKGVVRESGLETVVEGTTLLQMLTRPEFGASW